MKRIFCLLTALALAAFTLSAGKPQQKIVILGDSYSTFENLIPEGYACWYFLDPSNPVQNYEGERNDVHKASRTWWNILLKKTKSRLLLNSSYSGATISSTGYGGADYSDRSFVTRAKTDIVGPDGKPGRCGETPDIVLIFGGTNDRWANSPIGEILPPSEWEHADLTACMPSVSYLLGYLKSHLPSGTRIVMIVNTELGETFEDGFAKVCEVYGAECIQLRDIPKQLGHPSKKGMKKIASQVKAGLAM